VECGSAVAVSAGPDPGGVASALSLVAYPNPSRGSVTFAIRTDVAQSGPGRVRVYDTSGRLIRSIDAGIVATGLTRLDWDGTDDAGGSVASGTYCWRLESEDSHIATSKVTLLR